MSTETQEATGNTAEPTTTPQEQAPQAQAPQEQAPPVQQPVEAPKQEATPQEQPKADDGIKAAAEAKAAEGDGIKDAAAKAQEPKAEPKAEPIQYDLKTPEGVNFDDKVMESFKPVAQELNLSNEHAQKLVDFQAEQVRQQETAYQEQLKEQVSSWKQTQANDKNYQANVQLAGRGVDVIGEEAYNQLREMQLEWNPVIFNMLKSIGQSVSEGTLNVGGQPAHTAANTMYPAMAKYKREQGID